MSAEATERGRAATPTDTDEVIGAKEAFLLLERRRQAVLTEIAERWRRGEATLPELSTYWHITDLYETGHLGTLMTQGSEAAPAAPADDR